MAFSASHSIRRRRLLSGDDISGEETRNLDSWLGKNPKLWSPRSVTLIDIYYLHCIEGVTCDGINGISFMRRNNGSRELGSRLLRNSNHQLNN